MKWPLWVSSRSLNSRLRINSLTENLLEFGEIRLDTRAELEL